MPPIQPPVRPVEVREFSRLYRVAYRDDVREHEVDENVAIGVGVVHQSVLNWLCAEGHFASGVEGLSWPSLFRAGRKRLLLPIVEDFLSHPKLCVDVRDKFCPRFCKNIISSSRLQMPVRIERGIDATTRELHDALYVVGVAAVHQEAFVSTCEGQDVVFPRP